MRCCGQIGRGTGGCIIGVDSSWDGGVAGVVSLAPKQGNRV